VSGEAYRGIPGTALDVGDVHAEVIGVGCSVGIGFSR